MAPRPTLRYIGMRLLESAGVNSRSSTSSTPKAMAKTAKKLVICLDNEGYEVSLERRKIYVAIPDARAEKLGQVRIVDESGDDYLYPKDSFVEVSLPQPVRRAVLEAA